MWTSWLALTHEQKKCVFCSALQYPHTHSHTLTYFLIYCLVIPVPTKDVIWLSICPILALFFNLFLLFFIFAMLKSATIIHLSSSVFPTTSPCFPLHQACLLWVIKALSHRSFSCVFVLFPVLRNSLGCLYS